MSRRYESSATLHQQAGAMTPQAFAEREGLTLGQVKRCIHAGQILGAQQDSRSKRWVIYPPAKLLRPVRKYAVRDSAAPDGSSVPFPACGKTPSPGVARANGEGEFSTCLRPAAPVSVFAAPETKRVCRVLHEAAARQFREGLHYLRLDADEFALLYIALYDHRNRLRKLVGRGRKPVGQLRASDSVWHKLQAASREGRLL